jgi:hypothetical protein
LAGAVRSHRHCGSPAIVGGLSVVGCDVRDIAGTSVLVLLGFGVAITGFVMRLHLRTVNCWHAWGGRIAKP